MLLALAAFVPSAEAGGLRTSNKGPTTGMAGLEGNACPESEWRRYKTIVCGVQEACDCGELECALTWCADWVHDWKKEFGACILQGCESYTSKEEEKDDHE